MSDAGVVRYPLLAGRSLALVAITLSALNLRSAVTSVSPLLLEIGTDLGFGLEAIGIIGMLPPACFALFGVATPYVVRRFGLEQAALIGLAVTSAGVLLRSVAGNPAEFIAFSGGALGGMGIVGVVMPPLVRQYFSDRLSLVSTIYLIALHLGALVPPLVIVPLANAVGWRYAIALWAMLAILSAAMWAMARQRPATKAGKSLASTGAPAAVGVLPKQVWRSPTVWNLTILFGMTSWNVFILFTWLPTLVLDAGYAASFGGAMVSLLITTSMVIGIFAPSLTIKLRNPTAIVFGCAVLYAVGYGGLALAPQTAMVAWVILLGIGSSLFIVATTMINTHSRTPLGSAVTSSFVQGIGGGIAVLGPLTFGLIHSWTGTWGASYGLVAVSLAIIGICGFRARHHGTLEDDIERYAAHEGNA
ncbi:CynX/NimT family MFS transporter [Jiella mangrovi]|nr:MFS transporter [Jiella mangrovi]